MAKQLRLMCILAHPDDESLGPGGTLAKCAAEGVSTYIVSATRGERGRFGDARERPSLEVVGRKREAELRCAAEKLGVTKVSFLDYIDGDLSAVDPGEAVAKIAGHIREDRPQIVITFGPEGGYGHPDHIAICQFATAAIVCAADSKYKGSGKETISKHPHRVNKLYYMAWNEDQWRTYQEAFRDLKTVVDGVERRAFPSPDWMITTKIDTREYWQTVWEAVLCHKTQLTIYSKLENLPPEDHESIWGIQTYYRVFSTVNGGRTRESDLFDGLR